MAVVLWFDVGIVRYTTQAMRLRNAGLLWFDVGIVRYTTHGILIGISSLLWFDVGIVRYTTSTRKVKIITSCGLM